MVEAAERVVTIASSLTRSDLEASRVETLAIVRLLEIVGEAARGVSADSRSRYPEIPWQQLIGTRNRIVHAYFNVDLDIVWRIVDSEFPVLVRQLRDIQEDRDPAEA